MEANGELHQLLFSRASLPGIKSGLEDHAMVSSEKFLLVPG
jgi:hypothetical protein